MTEFPAGILPHCPWDVDPDWYPGKDYPPAPRDRPEEMPTTIEDAPAEKTGSGAAPIIRPPMIILQCAYAAIMRHLTNTEPEAGGMLLGPKGSPVVTHYVPDERGRATAASFTLDAPSLNRILQRFLECGVDAKGLCHSHPLGCTHPSVGDIVYVRRSFSNPKNASMAEFLLPIVSGSTLYPYVIGGVSAEPRIAQLIVI